MSLADASPAVTLVNTKKKYAIQCPNHDQEGHVVHQVFESPAANHRRRRRSHDLTPSFLTSSLRSDSPDDAELCLTSSNVPNPGLHTLIRDISLEEELQSKVLHLAQEIAMLKNKCTGLNRENLKLSRAFATHQQDSQAVVNNLRKDYSAKMEEMRNALVKSNRVREDIQSEKSALEVAFRQTLETSQREKSALKAELEQTRQEYDKVLRTVARTEVQLARAEKERHELRQQNEEVRKESQALMRLQEVVGRAMGNKLKESEMSNGFYQILFEIAAHKVKCVEEKQPQSTQGVFSPDVATVSSPLQQESPRPCGKRRRGAAVARSESFVLLQQILQESIESIGQKSSDTQSVNSVRSGDSGEGRESERLDSAGTEQSDSKDSSFELPSLHVRGCSEPNILSPYFLQKSQLLKFELSSPTGSDETSSGVSVSSSRFSSELSDALTTPNDNKTPSSSLPPFRRRGAHRVPFLKSYTVDDERLTPPRLKFRSNTDFDQSEDIPPDTDDIIIVESANQKDKAPECCAYASSASSSQEPEVKSPSRSGFKVLKQRRNGITDPERSFPLPVLASQGKAKKSKGRELADMFRKFTGGDSERNKGLGSTPRKRSKAIKDDHVGN